jgi:hypothetical protein
MMLREGSSGESDPDMMLREGSSNEVEQDMVLDAEVEEIPESYPEYAECKDELAELLQSKPRMSRQRLADHFGVPKATVLDWIVAVRKETQLVGEGE